MTIGLAISLPLVVVAFHVDQIADVARKLRGQNRGLGRRVWGLWRIVAYMAAIAAPVAAILTPFWTSSLSTASKVALTITLLLIFFTAAVAYGIWLLVMKARESMSVTGTSNSDYLEK